MTKPATYKCRKCRQVKSHHNECEGKYFCAGTEDEAEFKRYVASPNRISNSFSGEEITALDFVATKLLTGSFGPQPATIENGIRSLAKKVKTMKLRLDQQKRDHG